MILRKSLRKIRFFQGLLRFSLRRMAQDDSPDISGNSKTGHSSHRKIKKELNSDDLDSQSLFAEILTRMSGHQGSDLEKLRKDFIESATIRMTGIG